MKVACEKCGAVYDIDDKRIPSGGLNMKCPKCLSSFRVTQDGTETVPESRPGTILGVGLDPAALMDKAKEALPGAGKKPDGTDAPSRGVLVTPPLETADGGPVSSGPAATATALDAEADFYVRRFTGRIFGPFPVDAIKNMLAEGKLEGTEEVSSDRENWVAVKAHPLFGGEATAKTAGPPAKPTAAGFPAKPTAAGFPAKPIAVGPADDSEADLPVPKFGTKQGMPVPPGRKPAASPVPSEAKARLESEPELPVPKMKGSAAAVPVPPKVKLSSKPDFPIPKERVASEADLPVPKAKPSGLPPSPKVKLSSQPDFPIPKARPGSEPGLPAPKRKEISEPELPVAKAKPGSGPPLPSTRPDEISEPELPAVKTGSGVRQPGTKEDRISKPELPVPKGGPPPVPAGDGGGGAARADLPTPKHELPTPKHELPTPKHDLPTAKHDLPTPKGGKAGDQAPQELSLDEIDLPAPGKPSPVPASAEPLDLSELDLVEPKKEPGRDEGEAEVEADEEDRVSGVRELSGGTPALEMPGAEPIELDELDLVAPKEGGRPGGLADEADLLAPLERPSSEPVRAGAAAAPAPTWFEENRRLVMYGGIGAGVVALAVVGAIFLFKSDSSKPKPRKESKPIQTTTQVRALPEMAWDTPTGYEKSYSHWKKALKSSPGDPALLASAAKAVFCNLYRYGGRRHLGWARDALTRAKKRSSGEHPELLKARAVYALTKGKSKTARDLLKPLCKGKGADSEACVFLGWAELKRGRAQRAEKAFKKALRQNSKSAAAQYGLGRAALLRETVKKARSAFRKAAKLSSGHLEALIELARLEVLKRAAGPWDAESKKAQELLARVLTLATRAEKTGLKGLARTAMFARAAVSSLKGAEDEALRMLSNVVQSGTDPVAMVTYGLALGGAGRYKEAHELLTKVRKKNKKSRTAAVGLARSLLGLGEPKAALELVREIWKGWPKDASLRVLRGDVNLARGKPESAEKYYKKALALDPKFVPAYLAWIRLRTRDAKKRAGALAQLEQLAVQGITHPDLVCLKGEIHAASKQWVKAVQNYQKALGLRPQDNRYRIKLAQALLGQGKLEPAHAELTKVWARAKSHPGVGLAMATYQLKLGVQEKALSVLQVAVKHRPTLKLRLALAEAYMREGNKKLTVKAVSLLEGLVTRERDNARVRFLMGKAYLALEKSEQALDNLKRASVLNPKDMEARLAMARAHMVNNKLSKALTVLNEALKVNPKAVKVLEYRAELRFERGAVLDALKDLGVALKESPNASAYTLKAQCLIERRRKSAALRALKKAIRKDPRYPKAYFVLGRIQYQAAKLRGATKTLRKALTLLEEEKAGWVVDTHYMLGTAYVELRKRELARKHLSAFLKMTENDQSRRRTRQEAARKLRSLEK